jgi:hypothetical protein
MALAQARVASIANNVEALDFGNARTVLKENDANKINLRHLRLTFESLDRLFALKTRKDIFKINTDEIFKTRLDGATNNAEAFLGDAARNAFLAREYLTMAGTTPPADLETDKVITALQSLDGILKVGMNKEQKAHYENGDAIWDSIESQFGFTNIPAVESSEGEIYWVDFFNRVIRDQRFELFDALKNSHSPEIHLIGDMRPEMRDGIELFGFIGKELDLSPLGSFGNDETRFSRMSEFARTLMNQIDLMPNLEKIKLDPKDQEVLLQLPSISNSDRLRELVS